MNFSDCYRCFFVHIPKSAGTSIKHALGLPGRGHPPWHYLQQTFPRRWRDYRTFAVVRNPWDRFVSAYAYARMENSFWHGQDKGMHPDYEFMRELSFDDFCLAIEESSVRLQHESWFPQCCWVSAPDSGTVQVDQLLRYENLGADFKGFCEEIGAPNCVLPVINASQRKAYREYYTGRSRDLIGKLYRQDIELFDYTF